MHASDLPHATTLTGSGSISGSGSTYQPPQPQPHLPALTSAELTHLIAQAHDAGQDTSALLAELSRRHWGSGADTAAAASLRARPAAVRCPRR